MGLEVAGASHVVQTGDGWVRLALSGEFDVLVVHDLDEWLCEAADGLVCGNRMMLDFTAVTFFDAGCSAVLARTHHRLRRAGVQLHVVGVRRPVAKVFTVLGLGDLIVM